MTPCAPPHPSYPTHFLFPSLSLLMNFWTPPLFILSNRCALNVSWSDWPVDMGALLLHGAGASLPAATNRSSSPRPGTTLWRGTTRSCRC